MIGCIKPALFKTMAHIHWLLIQDHFCHLHNKVQKMVNTVKNHQNGSMSDGGVETRIRI